MNHSMRIVLTMAIGIFLCLLDTTVMNIALPVMQTGLSTSLTQLSWALNVYTILFASLTIPLGRLADIYGRSRLYLVGLSLFLIGSLSSGLAANVGWLIAGRGLQSLGAAIVFPASMTIGIQSVAPEKRTSAIAILGATQGLAAALGPTIGGAVTQFFGWRGIFLINVPFVILAFILCLRLLSWQHQRPIGERLDLWGSLLSMTMLFSLTLALVKGDDWGWTSGAIIGLAVTSIVALDAFLFAEAHVDQPMVPLALFKDRQFTGSAIVTVIAGVFMVAIMVLMPSYFTRVMGKSELMAALMITPTSLMIFIFSPLSGFLLAKLGPRLVIFSGSLAIACGYGWLSILNPRAYWQLVIVFVLVGMGYGIVIGPITVLAAGKLTGMLLTASQSVIGVFRQIGTSLAVAIFVSALSTNLVTAKQHIWQSTQDQVASLSMSAQAKTDTLATVKTRLKQA
ncbi:MFS transporter [Lactobacillus paraplantarum] [Lactiplantibacillus mudanjiangensis]|nr:MFS transporter [Lactobacillus paraplantarum] [Lactiplantibacillus mudanjiangensis]